MINHDFLSFILLSLQQIWLRDCVTRVRDGVTCLNRVSRLV